MGALGKLAIGGTLVGTMLALTLAATAHRPVPVPDALPLVDGADEINAPTAAPDFGRCRVITAPDAGCEAAWDARRRHFFDKGVRP